MFEEIISQISVHLSKHKIPHMIIGGQAVLLYGEPRLTRDIDITLGVGIDSLDTVLSIIKELKLRILSKNIIDFVKKTMVLPMIEKKTGIRVDFIFSFTPYEKEAIKRANIIEILGEKVPFASVEDLIIHKIFAGRPRDLEDVRTIILKNPNLDVYCIKKCLKLFDFSYQHKNFLKTFENMLKTIQTSRKA